MAVHWWEYSRSVEEYTFAQPPQPGPKSELRAVLSEKTPVVMEIGPLPWRPVVAEKAPWRIEPEKGQAVSVGVWLAEGPGRPRLTNGANLALQMDLANGLKELNAGKAWWWLPSFQDYYVDILPVGGWTGLVWVTAERQWIGCSHGCPLKVWLAHSKFHSFIPEKGVNPWTITVEECPWLARVQYIEVIVRPGWVLGLPAHWGWAAAPSEDAECWWWTASQHSPASLAATLLQEHIESTPKE